jgi:methyltransferase family protein
MPSSLPDPLEHPVVFSVPRRLSPVTSWQEHTPFAMYAVAVLRPTLLVELGTHFGDSYCSFCQAVSELQRPTSCFAVDTWRGDEHSGTYGDDVLADLRAHHDPLYGLFSELLQTTFDEAVQRFDDGSIDLLHVDGCHLYEQVRHDFDTWRPKMSERGVVLLHDAVRRVDEFGVWRLVEELRADHAVFEFTHGNGLAVVLLGNKAPQELRALTELDSDETARFRAFFAALGAGVRRAGEVQRAATEYEKLRAYTARLEVVAADRERQVDERLQQLELQSAALKDEVSTLSEAQRAGTAELSELRNAVAAVDRHITDAEAHMAYLRERATVRVLRALRRPR